MEIRKISIGADYKSGAMHYIVGQEVLNGSYKIHLIKYSKEGDSYIVYIEDETEAILQWKEFNCTMPISNEYNINI